VLIKNLANNSETSATLVVSDGNPYTVNKDKCSVKVERSSIGNFKWSDAGGTTPTPTEQIHVWRAFLNEAAIALLCTNDESPEYGELSLTLSFTE
jgi:hypothetical protein